MRAATKVNFTITLTLDDEESDQLLKELSVIENLPHLGKRLAELQDLLREARMI